MIRKMALCMAVAIGLAGGTQAASAQTRSVNCMYTWCWTYVQVVPGPSGPVVNTTWNEFRMPNRLFGVTLAWMLVGSPDYELRTASVVITGANAPGSAAQLPFRQVLPERYAMDDLNTNSLTYTYELRVYRKGSPTPVTTTGSIVNSY